jgi:hypothetical protein
MTYLRPHIKKNNKLRGLSPRFVSACVCVPTMNLCLYSKSKLFFSSYYLKCFNNNFFWHVFFQMSPTNFIRFVPAHRRPNPYDYTILKANFIKRETNIVDYIQIFLEKITYLWSGMSQSRFNFRQYSDHPSHRKAWLQICSLHFPRV